MSVSSEEFLPYLKRMTIAAVWCRCDVASYVLLLEEEVYERYSTSVYSSGTPF